MSDYRDRLPKVTSNGTSICDCGSDECVQSRIDVYIEQLEAELEASRKDADALALAVSKLVVRCNHKPEGWDELDKAFKAHEALRGKCD